jgi:hypothetical protein
MLDPVSETKGGRKYSFEANGQMGFFQRLYSRNARHDCAMGSRVEGPDVFLDCVAELSMCSSEPHHRYAIGGLFDNVVGADSFLAVNRGNSGSGHGWAGAQMVFWNCGGGGGIFVMQPPGAQNYAIGYRGKAPDGERPYKGMLDWIAARSTKRFEYKGMPIMGDGYIESPNAPVTPRSLYLAQLRDRLGEAAVRNVASPAQLDGTIHDAIRPDLSR